MNDKALIPHLFRTEYSKIVAVLCKSYGIAYVEIAEDIVSDTFLKATETWGLKGMPDNPTAWLYAVAKNRTKDHFKRKQVFSEKIIPNFTNATEFNHMIDFSEENISDSMLQMMYAVCHQSISQESQIALALRVLCGFSIDEIANALLSNKTNVNKRLARAKEKLRKNNFGGRRLPEVESETSTSGILAILYLLFNEGYFSTATSEKVRKDLCFEAMRLLHIIVSSKASNQAQTNALMALFCFQASRFEARTSFDGTPILYDNQNTELWCTELISKGEYYLGVSSVDKVVSKYHLEALIAFWHTRKSPNQSKKWENILRLYDRLLQYQYSPVAALNRTYALAMVKGRAIALEEALKIKMEQSSLYHSLLADLYIDIDPKEQIKHLHEAIKLTKNESDKCVLERKLKKVVRD